MMPEPENENSMSLTDQIVGGGTPRNALITSLIVGTILTAINHGSVILSGSMPELYKIILTYCVPYLVATWGAVSEKRSKKS